MDKIPLPSVVSQMCLRNLGMYSSSYLGNDLYFLMEAINLLVATVGDEKLEKFCEEEGEKWEDMKDKLDHINKLIVKVKTFYDPIQNKDFDKKSINLNNTQKMFKKYFVKTAKKISLYQRDIYKIFIFLVNSTTLQQQTIPSEAFKILEHKGFRKMDLSKKPIGAPTEGHQ